MSRRWAKIAATVIVGAAAPHVASDNPRLASVASAAVAVAALFMRRPQDWTPAQPKPQDAPKS